jgi:putative ABC transport system substrate-binding protein
MNRRTFLCGLTLGALSAPLAPEAQQTRKAARIGYLSAESSTGTTLDLRRAFGEGLRSLGWIEGETIVIEERWAKGKVERLAELAAELVQLKMDVIVAAGPVPVIRAAKQATPTVPIVMALGIDPVGQGFISASNGLVGTSPG